jgi:hypothetical protein
MRKRKMSSSKTTARERALTTSKSLGRKNRPPELRAGLRKKKAAIKRKAKEAYQARRKSAKAKTARILSQSSDPE